MSRFIKIILIFSVGLFLMFNCNKKSPEQIITQVNGVIFKGAHQKSDEEYFLKFFKEMQQAVANEDLEKSFSFYSKDFKNDEGIELDTLKRNTALLYKNYDNIVYKMSNINIFIKGDKAISIDEFSYSAVPVKRGYGELSYTGKERIYWQKEGNVWKIVNWVFEK